MKSLRALKAAALILAAVMLGLMTVQGSYALWNAVVPSNAGTIQAADFNVSASWGDTTHPLPLDLGVLQPGKPVVKTVTVVNDVNSTSEMKVAPRLVSTTTGAPMLQADGDFKNYISVTSGLAGPGGTCQAATQAITVAQKSNATLCISVTLADNVPARLAGKSISLPVTLIVSQI